MGNFIVSARKYRPETFKSVVGQDAITATLKNAIKANHIGHAYLFCGPRGVGKTTCARILAKTINCSDITHDTEPCNKCESCSAFNNSRSYNIHELDAASNNSIDDIRLLIEKVRIPPQTGKFSVYIIDEVHMLSASAFNAFLKTLEEPPAHAIFILATTEKHKIIPTILSRCQIFDFNRIKITDIVDYLSFIANKEKVDYEPEALHIIAEKADGAMRDALTIFDQVVSYSNETVKYQDIIEILNILDYEYYFNITEHFLAGNTSEALLLFDEILNNGFDARNFISGLGSHFRNLLVSKDPETIKLLEVSDRFREKYLKQSEQCPGDFIFTALNICNETDLNYRISRNQRLLSELAIIKLSRILEEKKKSGTIQDDNPVKPEITGINKEADSDLTIIDELIPARDEIKVNQDSSEIKKNLIKTPGISIKHIVSSVNTKEEKEKEEEKEGENNNEEQSVNIDLSDEENIEEILSETPFSQEELILKWKEYAELINDERPRIAILLKNKVPVLKDGYEISLTLDNTVQMNEFDQNIRTALLNFLKKELNNSYIRITSSLEKNESTKRILYTPEEQFQYLSRKNPALIKLRQKFSLDFE